jgi:hypothetical protein
MSISIKEKMMKKILLTIAIVMISNAVLACGGIAVKGKYCLSKHTMNWYSASAWCQAQRMNLINMNTVCGKISGACSELQLSSDEKSKITSSGGTLGNAWTNISSHNNGGYAYSVKLDTGNIEGYPNGNRYSSPYYALCQ